MNWFGLYPITLGVMCLFFPGLIVFGYGAEGFMDWFMVIFLVLCCCYIILLGVGILSEDYPFTHKSEVEE